MKTKYWIIIIAALALVCTAASFFLLRPKAPAKSVEIFSDGVSLYNLNLDTDTTIEIVTEKGKNIICIQDGKIAVIEADCPDKHCISRGFCDSGAPIVCLPNRLVLQFSSESVYDAISG